MPAGLAARRARPVIDGYLDGMVFATATLGYPVVTDLHARGMPIVLVVLNQRAALGIARDRLPVSWGEYTPESSYSAAMSLLAGTTPKHSAHRTVAHPSTSSIACTTSTRVTTTAVARLPIA